MIYLNEDVNCCGEDSIEKFTKNNWTKGPNILVPYEAGEHLPPIKKTGQHSFECTTELPPKCY